VTRSCTASVADAIRPLLPLREPGDDGPSACFSAGDVLALGLDLSGGLELESRLCETARAPRPPSRRREAGEALSAELALRLERIAAPVERRLREIEGGRSRIPEADVLHADLALRGLLTGRGTAASLRAAARAASEPYLLVIAGCIDRVRGEVRALRFEIAETIASLGENARRIESLDAAIGRARARFARQLFARIAPALANRFEVELQAAVRTLPPEARVAELAAWYRETGWLTRFQRDALKIVSAVIEHERTALEGLVEAARRAEEA